MRKIVKHPIYLLTLAYIAGVVCSEFISIPFPFYGSLLAPLILFSLWIYTRSSSYKLYSLKAFFTLVSVLVTFFGLGLVHRENEKPQVISHKEYPVQSQFVITEVIKPTARYHRYYAHLLKEQHQLSHGFLLNIPKDEPTLEDGDVCMSFFRWNTLPKAREPYGFDYAFYLHKQDVFAQAYLSKAPTKIGVQKSWHSTVSCLRNQIVESFSPFLQHDEQKRLIQSLLFGQRKHLSTLLADQYKNAGVMHVLAVSGLHVLVVFGLIYRTVGWVTRNRKILFVISSVLLLLFAFLSGLSGSVVRAVLMCLLYLWAMLWQRQAQSMNVLFTSAFLILWFSTDYLYNIGFQLSYLALLSILYVYPMVQQYFYSKNVVLNYFYGLIGISLVVQLGVAPLSMYYFHQFSWLFLIGNIVIVPISMLVLIVSIVQIPFNFFGGIIPEYMGKITRILIDVNHQFLQFLTKHEWGLSKDIYIEIWELIALFIGLFLVISYVKYREEIYFYSSLLLIVLFGFLSVYYRLNERSSTYILNRAQQLEIVYSTQKSIVSFYTGKNIPHYPYWKNKTVDYFPIKNYVDYQDKYLIIDSLSVIPKNTKVDYILLHQQPKIHLEELLKNNLQPKKIIISSNNPTWKVEQWKTFLDKHQMEYIDLGEIGYWEVE